MNMPNPPILAPHQIRVIDEKKELADNLAKLGKFISENPSFPALPVAEKTMLRRQKRIMEEYLQVLDERINLFYRQAFLEHLRRTGMTVDGTMSYDDSSFFSADTEAAYRKWKPSVTPKDEA